MNNLLWEEAVRFHGHECPGLAIGMRACEAIIDKMNIKPNRDEIICITENVDELFDFSKVKYSL